MTSSPRAFPSPHCPAFGADFGSPTHRTTELQDHKTCKGTEHPAVKDSRTRTSDLEGSNCREDKGMRTEPPIPPSGAGHGSPMVAETGRGGTSLSGPSSADVAGPQCGALHPFCGSASAGFSSTAPRAEASGAVSMTAGPGMTRTLSSAESSDNDLSAAFKKYRRLRPFKATPPPPSEPSPCPSDLVGSNSERGSTGLKAPDSSGSPDYSTGGGVIAVPVLHSAGPGGGRY